MKYFSLCDLIQISVEDSYPWVDTLFINAGLATVSAEPFTQCDGNVTINKVKNLNLTGVRTIGDGAYIGDRVYVDEKFGVRFERLADKKIYLEVTQECNEWLMIAIELILLAQGKTLVHAAAVEKDGNVILMPSWGGVGKTATVCCFVEKHNWKLLGDDLIIVDGKSAIPFLKPFVIYPYHKKLFPQLFNQNKDAHIVKNLAISALMSKAIPTVKRLTRPFPRLLAYLRKHNPQSMRVSPRKIFREEQLSRGGKINQVVWLERCTDKEVKYIFSSVSEIASKACMVTSVELFADKLNSIFHMGGCGLFSYDETIGKMHNLIRDLIDGTDCNVFEIPTEITIDCVGDVIYSGIVEKD